MFLLSKVLPQFVLPLGMCLILLVWGLARRRRAPMLAALVVLLVSTNPYVGSWLMRATENWAVRPSAALSPVVDAIVVLSAGRGLAPGPERVSEWGDPNRFFGGVELFQAGKAPLLVFTAAPIAGAPDLPTEGDLLARQAMALGVPADRIAITGRVANTADEAREVASLLRARQLTSPKILLVTSAFHMRRARLVFEQHGFVVTSFPVDFALDAYDGLTLMRFLPSVDALRQTHTALRELYGRAFYWLWGAVAPR
ncbi:MAG TPA: YdcF family protein [Vicinamibacterales bacterium]|jgi:uncharacterized SAM-binding protein YcdF (DUF218 family)|nr:YdcF family protein [Acidobacteriota bacterium]HQX80721.1 YdcF family protein [Vicinamibacterales bacterium]